MKPQPMTARLAVRSANPWLRALCTAPLVLALGMLATWALTGAPTLIVVPHLLVATGVLHFMNEKRKPYARTTPALVNASVSELRVDGESLPRERLRRALYIPLPRERQSVVRVERKHHPLPLELVVSDEAEGRRLLSAMGLDASQSVASFRAMSRTMVNQWTPFLVMLGLMPLLLGIASLVPSATPYVMPALMTVAVAVMVMPTRVEVGADGVLMTWLGRRRFIPAGQISGASSYEDGIGRSKYMGAKLFLTSGQEVKIPLGTRWSQDDVQGLVERVREALESHRRGDVESSAALLARGARPVAEWVRGLKGLGAGATATLRSAAVDAERLWRVLESPSAPAAERAAAAVALSTTEQEGAKARIRVAASAVAEPRLRVAIEAASGEDDAAIERAIEQLEGESVSDRRRGA